MKKGLTAGHGSQSAHDPAPDGPTVVEIVVIDQGDTIIERAEVSAITREYAVLRTNGSFSDGMRVGVNLRNVPSDFLASDGAANVGDHKPLSIRAMGKVVESRRVESPGFVREVKVSFKGHFRVTRG
jgi:hypothetical protein